MSAEATRESADFLYGDLTYQIRGACFEVWNVLGGGLRERTIQQALERELRKRGIAFQPQARFPICYDGEVVGTYIPDFVVEEKVVLELKRKPMLTRDDERQFWRYLYATPYRIGLLINFGPKGVEIKRRIFDQARVGYPRSSADNPR